MKPGTTRKTAPTPLGATLARTLTTASALALAATLAFAAACGDDDSTGPGDVGHELEVTGAVNATLRGEAVFGTVEAGNQVAWGMVMRQSPMVGFVSFARVDVGERPGVGVYAVKDGHAGGPMQGGFLAPATLERAAGTFTAVAGEVTVTESSEAVLAGTIDVTYRGALSSEPEEIVEARITGTFRAVPGSIVEVVAE